MKIVLPTAEGFVRARARVEEMLKEFGVEGVADVYEVYRREGARGVVTKTIYYLDDPDAVVEVRRRLADLQRMRQGLERNPAVTITRGLWLPAVADRAAGDTQVNVHISQNWASKTMTSEEIEGEIGADAILERVALSRYREEHRSFVACRASGSDCRVAICNPMARDGSGKIVGVRTQGLNDYCVVLGGITIVYPQTERHRRKRADAWRGAEEPLFRFRGRGGQMWEVHRPRI